jgi:hypothetical protein
MNQQHDMAAMFGSGELTDEGTSAPLHDRLAGLAAFLPTFQAAELKFGHWEGGTRQGDVLVFPCFVPSNQARLFFDAAYRLGWVLTDFDWPAWKETPEAKRLRDEPAALANATPEQLARLLTVCIRQDRFVEGALASAFESGLLIGVLRRAAELAAATGKGGHPEPKSRHRAQ